MCSRIVFEISEEDLTAEYAAEIGEDCIAKPVKKDIRITDEAWVITADEPDRLQQMHFGLVPWNALECKMTASTFNARKDKLLISPLWSKLMKAHKRCIIITSGFAEPQKTTDKTKHWKFTPTDRKTFPMAGLWSEWRDKVTGVTYRSFAIITHDGNAIVNAVHDKQRIPVILTPEQKDLWLRKDLGSMDDYLALLETYPDERMQRDQTFPPGAEDKPKEPPKDEPPTLFD